MSTDTITPPPDTPANVQHDTEATTAVAAPINTPPDRPHTIEHNGTEYSLAEATDLLNAGLNDMLALEADIDRKSADMRMLLRMRTSVQKTYARSGSLRHLVERNNRQRQFDEICEDLRVAETNYMRQERDMWKLVRQIRKVKKAAKRAKKASAAAAGVSGMMVIGSSSSTDESLDGSSLMFSSMSTSTASTPSTSSSSTTSSELSPLDGSTSSSSSSTAASSKCCLPIDSGTFENTIRFSDDDEDDGESDYGNDAEETTTDDDEDLLLDDEDENDELYNVTFYDGLSTSV